MGYVMEKIIYSELSKKEDTYPIKKDLLVYIMKYKDIIFLTNPV